MGKGTSLFPMYFSKVLQFLSFDGANGTPIRPMCSAHLASGVEDQGPNTWQMSKSTTLP